MDRLDLTEPRQIARGLAVVLLLGGLAACGSSASVRTGIQTLGADFVRAFNQSRNDMPLDASALNLTLTPAIEPFDP
jgi:hypothetical protein